MKQGQSGMLYNGYAYDFNHAPDISHHTDNMKDGGDGFEILHKYELKISADEQREIEIPTHRHDGGIGKWLKSNGDAQRVHDGRIDIPSHRKSKEGNDGLDSSQLSDQSDIQGSERTGRENSEGESSIGTERFSVRNHDEEYKKAIDSCDLDKAQKDLYL